MDEANWNPNPRQPCLERREPREDRTTHLGRTLARHSQLRHRPCSFRIREVRRPDEAHLFERQFVICRALRQQFVELARPGAQSLGRSAEDFLVELRPASIPHRAERVNSEHAKEPLRQRCCDVQGEMPTPRVTDDVRLVLPEHVENAAGVRDVRPHCERSFRRRRRKPTLLIPRDVVSLRKLIGEIPHVLEAETRPSVQ